MKNSTLLFRSLLVIVFIAGGAHLVTYASQNSPQNFNSYDDTTSVNSAEKTSQYTINNETDYIVGKWIVKYNEKEFKGSILYEIQKEGNKFNAYTVSYLDKVGHSEKAKKTKTLSITSFDGYKGKGIYEIEYEGEIYDVDCTIDMVDENTFQLSYNYYEYNGFETWKKQ
ncbi:hypothetical protein [uncultured Kordia sp.]|uniref:hypothetical protein n=1 Tax=uncultured Kordia sp. TaxID=507699 RepID=UPI0026074177|nr:hypothetical protein [uncultured Kordia sp.]